MQFENLFKPIKIGSVEIKNRIVLSPMNVHMSDGKGYISDQDICFHVARAKGGVGLIQLTVASLGRPYASQLIFGPGVLGMMTDDHIAGCRRFVDAIHSHGTKISFSLV